MGVVSKVHPQKESRTLVSFHRARFVRGDLLSKPIAPRSLLQSRELPW